MECFAVGMSPLRLIRKESSGTASRDTAMETSVLGALVTERGRWNGIPWKCVKVSDGDVRDAVGEGVMGGHVSWCGGLVLTRCMLFYVSLFNGVLIILIRCMVFSVSRCGGVSVTRCMVFRVT